jgi:hypothetical protein
MNNKVRRAAGVTTIILGVLTAYALNTLLGLNAAYDPTSAFIVVPLIVIAVVFVKANRQTNWQQVCVALGVPIGVLGAVVGFHGMTLFLSNVQVVYLASAIGFLTILYGGLISAIGYFATASATETAPRPRLTPLQSTVLSAILIGLLAWMYDNSSGIDSAMSLPAFLLIVTCIVGAFYLRKEVSGKVAAEASIFGAMLTLVLGIIFWYDSDGKSTAAINMMMCGLAYGVTLYMLMYFLSLARQADDFVDVGRANWHWLEISAFLIFMFYAPETMRESLGNQLDAAKSEKEAVLLEEKLQDYEQRITDLEQQLSSVSAQR